MRQAVAVRAGRCAPGGARRRGRAGAARAARRVGALLEYLLFRFINDYDYNLHRLNFFTILSTGLI
jgi:hypothetical protein